MKRVNFAFSDAAYDRLRNIEARTGLKQIELLEGLIFGVPDERILSIVNQGIEDRELHMAEANRLRREAKRQERVASGSLA